MSLSANNPLPVVVIGNPESNRIALFQAALAHWHRPPAQVVAYADLLAGRVSLLDGIPPGAIVRIESPGRNFAVEQAILALGAATPDPEGERYERASQRVVSQLAFDRGAILWPRQWYLGWSALLTMLAQQLTTYPPHHLMNDPADIALMFDKVDCHALLHQYTIPVPRRIGLPNQPISSYNELVEHMQASGCLRVFVKLAHGSSASGVVAYQTNGRQHQATTTVEVVREAGSLRLYNSRRIRTYHDQRDIADLINALCRHRVHVEQWLPKAGLANQTCDLRIVVIAGEVQHTVVRLSRSPMTNLHLLNQRGDTEALRQRMGTAAWEAVCRTCTQVMDGFPRSLYAGLDVLISPGYRRYTILECNAFGDLLPGVVCAGLNTYAAELGAIIKQVLITEHC